VKSRKTIPTEGSEIDTAGWWQPPPVAPAGPPHVQWHLRSVDPATGTREDGLVGSLGYLAAVNVVIWVGLFLYLWRLDRRLAEREKGPSR